MEVLIPILFWVSIPVSLALSVMGVLKDKYWMALIGAALFFPVSYYFNGSPAFHGYGLFLPIFQVISAAAVKEGNKLWAWLLLLPAFLITFCLFSLRCSINFLKTRALTAFLRESSELKGE